MSKKTTRERRFAQVWALASLTQGGARLKKWRQRQEVGEDVQPSLRRRRRRWDKRECEEEPRLPLSGAVDALILNSDDVYNAAKVTLDAQE